MKSVSADLNRRGPNGTVRVATRRFDTVPTVGEHFIVNDGEDKFEGTVSEVILEERSVLLKMSWESASTQRTVAVAVSSERVGFRTSGEVPLVSPAVRLVTSAERQGLFA